MVNTGYNQAIFPFFSAGLQRLKVMANTIDDEREDPFLSLSDSDVEQEAINELDSDDENDENIDI